MRVKCIGFAAILAMGWCGLTAFPAAAQKFPSHLKGCKKQVVFESVRGEYKVPDMMGGVGVVRIVSQDYSCTLNGGMTRFSLFGMRDAAGQQIVPHKYAKVLPFSTTGALVIEPGDGINPKGLKYRVYTAGAGEGAEAFDFQEALLLTPKSKCLATGDSGLSVPVGRFWSPQGVSDVTLFTPSGEPRKLTGVGGEGLEPAVERFGDVFRARWRDDQGAVRTGLVDLVGSQVAPVLGASHAWSTLLAPGADRTTIPNCYAEVSYDLLIEGPSLDRDPAKPQYGSLLTLVGRNGMPAPLPKGAAGLINAYRVEENVHRPQQKNNTTMWAVVFPTKTGLEFALHAGPPGEALIAAETAPRYSELAWTANGWLMAKAKSDGRWRLFRRLTDTPVGEPNADLRVAFDSGNAIVTAEATASPVQMAYIGVTPEQDRAMRDRELIVAYEEGRLCQKPMPLNESLEWVTIYVSKCDARRILPEEMEKARAMGVTDAIVSASIEKGRHLAEQTQRSTAAFEASVRANAKRQSSYFPGQWESAIRAAGDALTQSINDSSDAWLQQRRDQYIADWQRSQRAY